MRIIIKPLGALCLATALVTLALLAFQRNRQGAPAAAPPAAAAAPTAPPAAAASSAAEPIRGHAIYRDGLENGWENWSWDTTVDMKSVQAVHSGKYALSAVYKAYGGVKFHHKPLDTHPFDRISFYVNGGATGGQILQIGGNCSEKDLGGRGVLLAALPAQRWVAVTLRLDSMDLAAKPDMTSFWIQNASGKPAAPVSIDEVRLLLPSEPAPTGTPLPPTGFVRQQNPSPAASAK